MQFQIQIVVEAEKASEATLKGETLGEVLSVSARPTQQRPAGLPNVPTNMRTGLPVNG